MCPTPSPALAVYADTDDAANQAADESLQQWIEAEPHFQARLFTAAEGIVQAMQNGKPPVVIADVQDNPGGGGSNDTTGLLHALIEAKAEGALMVHIADGTAAQAAVDA